MPKVVGIKFKNTAKIYYFSPGAYDLPLGSGVIVETARGVEFGTVAFEPTEISNDKIIAPLKPIIRPAQEEDWKLHRKLEAKRPDTMKIAAEKIAKSGLKMKLIDVEYTFDQTKLIIYFTADGRVDFRELVKDLAMVFRTRIELRQIGARDECKKLGGLGPCGRECCCSSAMNDYSKVTIKMAKNQNLSLNPTKISGLCGRLMCCLSYENAHYAETNKKMPKIGSEVTLRDGRKGSVYSINQLKETVGVKFVDGDENVTTAEIPLNEIRSKGKGSAADDMNVDQVDEDIKSLED